jgi:hypothetical protein
MTDYGKIRATTHKPGESVEASGIYRVIYDLKHSAEHEVTVVYGKKFSPFNGCGNSPRFKAVKLAQHIDSNEHFK